jgi:DNA-binding transcriptional LysR family regulator
MNFTLNQLQIYLKIVETNSITKASELLHLSQPAVSIQLKKFQEQFDISLTEVVGRKLYVTDFGKEIGEVVEEIIEQMNTINYKMLEHKGKLSGRLRISVVSTGKYVMPYFLSDFLSKNSGVQLQMDVTNKFKVVESLEKNEVDFALVSLLPNHLNIEKLDLMENKLHWIGKKQPEKSILKEKEQGLSQLPIIFREKGSGTRQVIEQFVEQHGIRIFKQLELTSNEAVKQAILAGLGYSLMPIIGIKNELIQKDLQIIPIPNTPITTNWSLVWLKDKKLSPVSKAYIKFLEAEKSKIVSDIFNWYQTI